MNRIGANAVYAIGQIALISQCVFTRRAYAGQAINANTSWRQNCSAEAISARQPGF